MNRRSFAAAMLTLVALTPLTAPAQEPSGRCNPKTCCAYWATRFQPFSPRSQPCPPVWPPSL